MGKDILVDVKGGSVLLRQAKAWKSRNLTMRKKKVSVAAKKQNLR